MTRIADTRNPYLYKSFVTSVTSIQLDRCKTFQLGAQMSCSCFSYSGRPIEKKGSMHIDRIFASIPKIGSKGFRPEPFGQRKQRRKESGRPIMQPKLNFFDVAFIATDLIQLSGSILGSPELRCGISIVSVC